MNNCSSNLWTKKKVFSKKWKSFSPGTTRRSSSTCSRKSRSRVVDFYRHRRPRFFHRPGKEIVMVAPPSLRAPVAPVLAAGRRSSRRQMRRRSRLRRHLLRAIKACQEETFVLCRRITSARMGHGIANDAVTTIFPVETSVTCANAVRPSRRVLTVGVHGMVVGTTGTEAAVEAVVETGGGRQRRVHRLRHPLPSRGTKARD